MNSYQFLVTHQEKLRNQSESVMRKNAIKFDKGKIAQISATFAITIFLCCINKIAG